MSDQSKPDGTGAGKQWLKIIGFLLALGAGLFFARAVGHFTTDRFGTPGDTPLAANLRAAAKQIRAQAPIKVDPITSLIGAGAIGDTIIYTMSLSVDIPTSQIAATQARLQALDTNRICGEAETRKLIDAGGKMRWIYTDTSGDQLQANVAKCP